MKVPYSRPLINQEVIKEVNDTLTNTGWLTSGPKVILLEKELKKLSNSQEVCCVNSWTSGAMLVLKWFNIGPGDEVIIPSYTYSATALAVLHVGALPVMVDVDDDFQISLDELEKKITSKTKAVMPVDIGGLPCNYDKISRLVRRSDIKSKFKPSGSRQELLNRILVIADAAHSIGSRFKDIPSSTFSDFCIYSFHSVKNITTGEGGAICINLPSRFNNTNEYLFFKAYSLNGQTKNAFEKNQLNGWKYDIIDDGLKANMPDICASIGLAQIRTYQAKELPERKKLFNLYNSFFQNYDWAITPKGKDNYRESSYHLYMLRISGISETKRDDLIYRLSKKDIGVNVHYIPMPRLTLFKNLGYKIEEYPNTNKLYTEEISLPLYNGLKESQLNYVCETLVNDLKQII